MERKSLIPCTSAKTLTDQKVNIAILSDDYGEVLVKDYIGSFGIFFKFLSFFLILIRKFKMFLYEKLDSIFTF